MTDIAANTEYYWQAWFDGAALPNPGKIGLGAVVVSPQGERFEKSGLAGRSGCNNEAELLALCAALELAYGAGARRLVVRGDSDTTVRYVLGPETTGIERLRELIQRARVWLARFDDVRLVWIPRHRNGEADGFSRQALGLAARSAKTGKNRRRRR